MYIEDFVRRIAGGWRVLLGSIMACVVIMGIFLAVFAPEYEGSIALRVGNASTGNPIESVPAVAARMRNAHVLRATLKELNLPGTDRQVDRLRSAIRVQSIDDNAFQMTLRWPDRAQALLILNRIANDMIAQHSSMQASFTQGILEKFHQLAANTGGRSAVLSPSVQTSSGEPHAEGNASSRGLQSLDDQAAAFAVTTPTIVIFPADVTEEPVFPKPAMMLALAVLIGLVIGVAWVFSSRPRGAR
ncbi:protein of unknown function [Pararobbsia alpina]|uniref:hypothetical protein n=1 Tax=Pararobbsia alpina TaxID=621374 RepID=UPI0039A6A7F3